MIKILVAEDDARLNKLICRYLKDSGFETKGCLHVQEAYDALYGSLYDLIISDIMMPGIDGFEFADTVRSVNEKIPILFISALEELSSIETLKTGFISNVSHEFKTPLSLLNNYATLLKSSVPENDVCQEYAYVIADSATRMSELVSNILRLNKLERHALSAQKAPFDLSRQICECVIMFENKWEEKNIEINMEVVDRCVIRSEESLLEMVWNNLISNAVKFTPVGGSITVAERRTQNQVIVTVTDTGCGIPAESLPHIFDKFYQADRSRATEGNGLGLALVRQVLRLLGGSITAESEENVGSTFTVTLPQE